MSSPCTSLVLRLRPVFQGAGGHGIFPSPSADMDGEARNFSKSQRLRGEDS